MAVVAIPTVFLGSEAVVAVEGDGAAAASDGSEYMQVSPDAVLVLTGSISTSKSARLELTVLYEYPLVFRELLLVRPSASAILDVEQRIKAMF